jgi:hypothetical protein
MPAKDDWATSVHTDMEEVNIGLTLDEMKNMKKSCFKTHLKQKISEAAFTDLLKIKDTHSKGKEIKYTKFELQDYMKNNHFTTEEKLFLFSLRSRTTNSRANFRSMHENTMCNLCEANVDQTDFHLIDCSKIIQNCQQLHNDVETEYEDLFAHSEKQLKATRLYMGIFEAKEKLEQVHRS